MPTSARQFGMVMNNLEKLTATFCCEGLKSRCIFIIKGLFFIIKIHVVLKNVVGKHSNNLR